MYEKKGGDETAGQMAETDSPKEKSLSSKEQAQVDQAKSMLQPIADKHGCEISDLLAGDEVEADDSEEVGETGKLDAIVARMKSKTEAME